MTTKKNIIIFSFLLFLGACGGNKQEGKTEDGQVLSESDNVQNTAALNSSCCSSKLDNLKKEVISLKQKLSNTKNSSIDSEIIDTFMENINQKFAELDSEIHHEEESDEDDHASLETVEHEMENLKKELRNISYLIKKQNLKNDESSGLNDEEIELFLKESSRVVFRKMQEDLGKSIMPVIEEIVKTLVSENTAEIEIPYYIRGATEQKYSRNYRCTLSSDDIIDCELL